MPGQDLEDSPEGAFSRPKYFMAVGMDWDSMEYARSCGHFHKTPQEALECISKERPTIQGIDVVPMAFGMSEAMMKKVYQERGIRLDDVLPPGFPRDDLPPGFKIAAD